MAAENSRRIKNLPALYLESSRNTRERVLMLIMIAETGKMVLILPYTEYEMQWVGDFNPKMINMIRTMADTYPSRKLKTYRYIFDRTVEFKRHPIF